jgi:hypothetical protein
MPVPKLGAFPSFMVTVQVIPALINTSGGTSSNRMVTGMRCASRTPMARGDKSQRPMRMPTAISVARIAKTIATMRPVVIAFLLHACANLPLAPLSFSSRSGCRALAFYISVAAWPRLPAADFLKMISNGMTASIAIIKSL